MNAAAASPSSGYSRMMYFTFPVSMYFSFSFGKVVTANAAQCGQVIEAYSMMVTGAVSEPIGMSSSGPLASSSSTEKVCASARPPRMLRNSKAPTAPRTPSASVAEVLMTNCQRVIIAVNLRYPCLSILAFFKIGSAFAASRQCSGWIVAVFGCSRSFDGGAQAAKGGPQIFVRDAGHLRRNGGGGGFIGLGPRCLTVAPHQRRLAQREPAHRLP